MSVASETGGVRSVACRGVAKRYGTGTAEAVALRGVDLDVAGRGHGGAEALDVDRLHRRQIRRIDAEVAGGVGQPALQIEARVVDHVAVGVDVERAGAGELPLVGS